MRNIHLKQIRRCLENKKSRGAQRMDLRERGCNAVRRKSAAKKHQGG
jgi:hypothetical protein